MPSAKKAEPKPTFFKTPADFRKWLDKHHADTSELWVGFHKKDSGKASITWPESVDEALSCGWIDGIRKRVDETSYKIRFTPRRARSVWSSINIKRVAELTKEGRMKPAGEKAFASRQENKSGIYAYEQLEPELPKQYAAQLRKHKAAAKFFDSQPPSYRKIIVWWIVSAKQEETRQKRLLRLIEASQAGKRV
jgi:uncharacterized protein YdeI (YjbR/CyaY-like superfamily)